MRLLVSGSTATVARIEKHREHLGVLLSPRDRHTIESVLATGLPWAVESGCFTGFAPQTYWRLCERAIDQPRLCWVVCPDVVGDGLKTLQWFNDWAPALHRSRLPVAFVLQDGIENLDIPWDQFVCAFIGGTTEFKLSHAVWDLCREAKRRDKLLHMGRVNGLRRMRIAQLFGCDSIDGSSASKFGDVKIPKYLRWLGHKLPQQPVLEFGK